MENKKESANIEILAWGMFLLQAAKLVKVTWVRESHND